MNNLAVKNEDCKEYLVELMELMRSDKKIFGLTLRSKNTELVLSELGYTLKSKELEELKKTIENINEYTNKQMQELSGKLFETISNYNAGCNGTCW